MGVGECVWSRRAWRGRAVRKATAPTLPCPSPLAISARRKRITSRLPLCLPTQREAGPTGHHTQRN